MTILSTIKTDLDTARKEKDKFKLEVLILLYSEVAKEGKKKNQETNDKDAIGVLKSFKSNLEICASVALTEEYRNKSKAEIEVVSKYIPQQLTRKDLENLVGEIWLASKEKPKLGVIMKHFKDTHGGTYDGTELKSVVDEYLTKTHMTELDY